MIGAQIGVMAAQFFYIVLMSRLLAPADFGLAAMAATVTAFASIFTDLGLSTATLQRSDIQPPTINALFLLNIAFGAALMLVICLLAPAASELYGDPRLMALVMASSLTIPLASSGAQHKALLARSMRFGTLTSVTLAAQISGFVLAAAAQLIFKIDYWALIVAPVSTAALSTLGYWLYCEWRPGKTIDWASAKSSIHFGLNLTGANLANYFNRQADNVLIGWYWGPAILGSYARAYTIFLLPQNLVNVPMSQVVVPSLASLQHDHNAWRNAFVDAVAAISLFGAALAGFVYLFAEHIVRIMLGPEWQHAALILERLSVALLVAQPVSALGWAFVSLGRTDLMLRWSLAAGCVILAGHLIGLRYGGPGVALAYSISINGLALPLLWYVSRFAPVTMRELVYAIYPPALLCLGLVLTAHGLGLIPDLGADSDLMTAITSLILYGGAFMAVYAAGATGAVFGLPIYKRLGMRVRLAVAGLLNKQWGRA